MSKIIFDIGAHHGQMIKKSYDENNIYHLFEPNPNLFFNLVKLCKEKRNVYLINKGVGGRNGNFIFNVADHDGCSSLLEFSRTAGKNEGWPNNLHRTHPNAFSVKERIKIEVITLYDYIVENNIEKVDFLKIDTQGNDLEVLKGLKDKINIVRKIKLEVQDAPNNIELYKDAPRKKDIEQFFKDTPFNLVNYDTQGSNNWELNLYYENSSIL